MYQLDFLSSCQIGMIGNGFRLSAVGYQSGVCSSLSTTKWKLKAARSTTIYRTSRTGNELPYYEPSISLDMSDQ